MNTFYYYDGTKQLPARFRAAQVWGTTEMAVLPRQTNFISTTDNAPFNFGVNNTHTGRIDR
ncbi:MAG: hypothetical protein IPI55_17255 [Flavobacteriales bacterium]|nr:hypothetical protein [Flavobacteriales bacterium]